MVYQTAQFQSLDSMVAPVREALNATIDLLSQQMKSDEPLVDQMLHHGNLLSGKRLRPTLLLLVAGCVGKIDPRHIQLAAAIEMIHTATLVHDDILDEADTRRHLPSMHHKWSTPSAVLFGDYLFSKAFYLASLTGCAHACQMIGSATNFVCEGELQQLGMQQNFEVTKKKYLEIVLGKTGRLISASSKFGTSFHQPEISRQTISKLESFGEKIGIAFQIHDDLLDLVGDSSETGKTLGTDMQNQKATLPIIRALELLGDNQKSEFVGWLRQPNECNRTKVVELIRNLGAIEYTRDTANQFATDALELITDLPENECKDALRALVQFVVSRQY